MGLVDSMGRVACVLLSILYFHQSTVPTNNKIADGIGGVRKNLQKLNLGTQSIFI